MEKSKTPFELRFDVLTMSKDLLDRAYETNREIALRAFEAAGKNSGLEWFQTWEQYVPKMYTPEEIKKNAEMLYEFVTNKDH